jgi:pilus assembly protein CpaF
LLYKEIRTFINENMDISREVSDEEVRDFIESAVFDKAKSVKIDVKKKQEIVNNIFNSMRRLDILQPFVEDETVTEIMVNGPDNVFIERDGRVTRLEARFDGREKLEEIIQTMVAKANRAVNESVPIVDARLPDGSRLNAVLQPVAINGPILTIRKFPSKPLTIEDMVRLGTLSENSAEALYNLVRAKYNIFICGGTGSGKTTLLNALAGLIPAEERIITIEDSAELQLTNAVNIVRLETRDANSEGKGQITVRDLIRASLRMRPERIIVGEVRGAEALDMLQAMNTGHEGSLSTGHANSSEDMIYRLETMVLGAAVLPLQAIRQQIASAIDVIIHISRMRDKTRKVADISEIAGIRGGKVALNKLFDFVEKGENENGLIDGCLERTGNPLLHTGKLIMAGSRWRL